MTNNRFKIIALRTGDRARQNLKRNVDFFKNLKENTIYPFCSTYSFPDGNFRTVEQVENEIDLYSIKNSKKTISISINAIVGENGSGKSSLIELLYYAVYNIGCTTDLLKSSTTRRPLAPFRDLDLDILYRTGDDGLTLLSFDDGLVSRRYYKEDIKKKSTYSLNDRNRKPIESISALQNFFYSIVINYSHYALNSEEIGNWIWHLFDKNDGYQTPIVLNPKRKAGIIDIGVQNKLLLQRLTATMLEPIGSLKETESLRNIGNGKIVKALRLRWASLEDKSYFNHLSDREENAFFRGLKEHFQIGLTRDSANSFEAALLNYILYKMFRISQRYPPYYKYRNGESLKYINAFFKRIRKGRSHIIFKIKGAILYLKYHRELLGETTWRQRQEKHIELNDIVPAIQDIILKENFFINTSMMVPPPLFETELILTAGGPFDSLSSGEKQRIHSLSTIVYHIININSIADFDPEEDEEEFQSYPYVNVVLDEIELYYHPEWQRNYISELLKQFGRMAPDSLDHIIGINITFLTHSPYILSDIPSSQTLRLVDGNVSRYTGEETFGANIHNILANDFFMKDGFMGELAKQKIEECVRFLNKQLLRKNLEETKIDKSLEDNEKKLHIKVIRERLALIPESNLNHEECQTIINLIGEPVLKNKLSAMYNEIYEEYDRSLIKEQILRLASEAGIRINFDDNSI